MIRSTPPQNPVDGRRVVAGRLVRGLYTSAIAALGLFLAWLVIKPFIYIQSHGHVHVMSQSVSSKYDVRIEQTFSSPGAVVAKGDPLFRLSSEKFDAQQLEMMMHLSNQLATEAELNIRLAVAREKLPSTQRRAQLAKHNLAKFEDHNCLGTSVFCSQIYREHAEADEALALAKAEIREIGKQLDILTSSRFALETEIQDLRDSWNNGIITAPRSGILGGDKAKIGDSVLAGHPIVEIFSPHTKHIDWILSEQYFHPPQVGDPLYVLHAGRLYRAMISRVLPLSEMRKKPDSLRAEVQSGQIIKAEFLSSEDTPPMSSRLEIRYNYWRWLDPLVQKYATFMEFLGVWRSQEMKIDTAASEPSR